MRIISPHFAAIAATPLLAERQRRFCLASTQSQRLLSSIIKLMEADWRSKLSVLSWDESDLVFSNNLAKKLELLLLFPHELETAAKKPAYFLTLQQGCLSLIDAKTLSTKQALFVDIEHRQGEQHSWPIAKTGAFAQAIGKKTITVVDATAGWGQDSLALFRMGFDVWSIERSPVMAELLADGFRRLAELAWVQQLNLAVPRLLFGNAIEVLEQLDFQPDCIYLDPMFPPKRKKSALAKKSIRILRELVGNDLDKNKLFDAALKTTGKRVVVKSPVDAEPLGGKPSESFTSKLLRYDVYLK